MKEDIDYFYFEIYVSYERDRILCDLHLEKKRERFILLLK